MTDVTQTLPDADERPPVERVGAASLSSPRFEKMQISVVNRVHRAASVEEARGVQILDPLHRGFVAHAP